MEVRDVAVIVSASVTATTLLLSYSELSRVARAEKRAERIQKIAAGALDGKRKEQLEELVDWALAVVVARNWYKTQPLFYPLNVLTVLLPVYWASWDITTQVYRQPGAAPWWAVALLALLLSGQSLWRLLRREYDLRTATMMIASGLVDAQDDVLIYDRETAQRRQEFVANVPKRIERFQRRVENTANLNERYAHAWAAQAEKNTLRRAKRHARKSVRKSR